MLRSRSQFLGTSHQNSLLYDEDFDDNLDLALKDLGIAHASRLLITNEDDDESNNVVAVNLYIEHRYAAE